MPFLLLSWSPFPTWEPLSFNDGKQMERWHSKGERKKEGLKDKALYCSFMIETVTLEVKTKLTKKDIKKNSYGMGVKKI